MPMTITQHPLMGIIAIKTNDLEEAIRTAYLEGLTGIQDFELSLPYSNNGFTNPMLKFDWKGEKISIPLQGNESLFNSAELDLIRAKPLLLLVEDGHGDCHLFGFDSHGRVYGETFSPSKLTTIASYDNGFGGYSVQASIPFSSVGRKEKEAIYRHSFTEELRKSLSNNNRLLPPLEWLKEACQKTNSDFANTLVDFLWLWRKDHPLLLI